MFSHTIAHDDITPTVQCQRGKDYLLDDVMIHINIRKSIKKMDTLIKYYSVVMAIALHAYR